MKTRVITSAVGLVVLFAVMALFDTFVFKRLRIFIGALYRIRCW